MNVNYRFRWRAMAAMLSRSAALLVLGGTLLLTGCATGPNANPRDPIEPFNRTVASFNDGVDRAVLKPVATAYVAVLPTFVRTTVSNFFGNLQDGWTFVNYVLQLRPQKAAESLMRFAINTGLGLGGFLDIATEAGLEKQSQDLGKTLGRWGVPPGPYIVLPIFGPSTLRDALTITAETRFDPVSSISPVSSRNTTTAVRLVNSRANYLRLGNVLDDAALDKYSFTRDAFLAKRNADVARSANNGKDEEDDADKEDKAKDDKAKDTEKKE